jgi:hypothetical protein
VAQDAGSRNVTDSSGTTLAGDGKRSTARSRGESKGVACRHAGVAERDDSLSRHQRLLLGTGSEAPACLAREIEGVACRPRRVAERDRFQLTPSLQLLILTQLKRRDSPAKEDAK